MLALAAARAKASNEGPLLARFRYGSVVSRFEADVRRLVLALVSRMVELARATAHDMAVRALEAPDVERPRAVERRSREARPGSASSRRALRLGLPRAVDEYERACIEAALRACRSVKGAAAQLRIARTTLQRKMRRMKIEIPRTSPARPTASTKRATSGSAR